MKKLDLKKIVEAMRPVKDVKKPEPIKAKINGSIDGPRVRDMRQEAMDMGSHSAKEMFGESPSEQ